MFEIVPLLERRYIDVCISFRGFSKTSTAELMLKRANRMKYNALRKKKMTGEIFRLWLKSSHDVGGCLHDPAYGRWNASDVLKHKRTGL